MDKTSLLDAIRSAHAPLAAAADALSDEALLDAAPGLSGWTRKDVLAHIEWWNRHSIAVIAGARAGLDPYPEGDEPWDIDAWNERVAADSRHRSASDVRAGEASSFAELVTAVAAASDEELFRADPQPWLSGTLAGTIEDDSTRHYAEHLPHLA